jgi:hypothetical protein
LPVSIQELLDVRKNAAAASSGNGILAVQGLLAFSAIPANSPLSRVKLASGY